MDRVHKYFPSNAYWNFLSQVRVSSAHFTFFVVLAHWSLVSRLTSLLVMSCLDSGGKIFHCHSHLPVHKRFSPSYAVKLVSPKLHSEHASLPSLSKYTEHFFPQCLKNGFLPFHDTDWFTVFSLPLTQILHTPPCSIQMGFSLFPEHMCPLLSCLYAFFPSGPSILKHHVTYSHHLLLMSYSLVKIIGSANS